MATLSHGDIPTARSLRVSHQHETLGDFVSQQSTVGGLRGVVSGRPLGPRSDH